MTTAIEIREEARTYSEWLRIMEAMRPGPAVRARFNLGLGAATRQVEFATDEVLGILPVVRPTHARV